MFMKPLIEAVRQSITAFTTNAAATTSMTSCMSVICTSRPTAVQPWCQGHVTSVYISSRQLRPTSSGSNEKEKCKCREKRP